MNTNSRNREEPNISVLARCLVVLVRGYQWGISPVLHALAGGIGHCRFTPTCSEYAMEAIREHGALRGGWLAVKRLARCHPWGGCGFDPVPTSQEQEKPSN